MSFFELDPQSIASRSPGAFLPSLRSSVLRGVAGFTLVSVAGFLPWGLWGKWFRNHGGEAAMVAACAVVFIALSGLLLHRLILGRGSLVRFYKLFGLAFSAYAAAWTAGWMLLRGHTGSVAGLFLGCLAMGWILVRAFEARQQLARVVAALFLLNSAGYFAGGVIEEALAGAPECRIGGHSLARPSQLLLAKMQWSVCYGVGLGAGLGAAFHLCQTRTREIITARQTP